nr:MAG TPA: hypothetical protein [Caudoviricetes sp.]
MSSIWFNKRHWSGEVLGDIEIPSLYRDRVTEIDRERFRDISVDTSRNESIDHENNIIQIGDKESRDTRHIVLFTYHRGDMTEWGMDERYLDNKERLILVECIAEYDYTREDPTMVYRQNRDVLITVKEIEQYLLDRVSSIERMTYDTREYHYMDLLDMLSVVDIFKRDYPDHDRYSHEVEYPLGRDTSALLLLIP